MVQKLMRDGIFRLAQSLSPIHHHVAIAQGSEVVKKRRGLATHPLPIFVGIDCAESIRHRTASTQRDAKIMNGFAAKTVSSPVRFPEHLVHPMDQARVFANWTLGSHQQSSLSIEQVKGNSSAERCANQTSDLRPETG
jgi:hypothetical protein